MKKKFLILLVIPCLFLYSCNKEKDVETISSVTENKPTILSNYTGLPIEETNTIPFLVMVENSQSARPQSGLSYADIIYETSAEGGIPRFMALFSSNLPEKIEPVRSVRQYFIDLSVERQLPFAHCGGSAEALQTISNNSNIMSINEIANGSYFWRDNTRVAPHNLYTSSDNIEKFIRDNNFTYVPSTFLTFSKSFFNDTQLSTATNVDIKVNRLYSTSYKFSNGNYIKYMDGEIAKDAITNKPLEFKNIVIQKTNITLQSDGNHLDIDLIGKGSGYVFSNGKYIEVTWEKNSKNDQTKLYDNDHNEIPLSPGNTIWNIVDNSSTVTID